MKDESLKCGRDIETHVCLFIKTYPISNVKKSDFKAETEIDHEMRLLKQFILQGWPQDKALLPDLVKPYFAIRDDSCIIGGLVFKSQRLVIPKKFRSEMIDKIHYTHLGLENCKTRAREILYWPTMNAEIKNVIQNCVPCFRYKRANVKEPMMVREIPDGPWKELGIDVFFHNNSNWLLIVDYFSK